MNVKDFLSDTNRNPWFEKALIENPDLAFSYLRTQFIVDLILLISSMVGIFAILVYKPDSMIYYFLVCAIFVKYIINVFSITAYIAIFIHMCILKANMLLFYMNASEEEREIFDKFISTLPSNLRDLYRESFDNIVSK